MLTPPLRAPDRDGAAVVWPSPEEASQRLLSAAAAFERMDFVVAGVAGGELRRRTRAAVSARLGIEPTAVWVATGHQPELHHAGVWFKDVLASSLADALAGVGLHVVTDLDTVKHTELAVPRTDDDGVIRVRRQPLFEALPRRCAAQIAPPPERALVALADAVRRDWPRAEVFQEWSKHARAAASGSSTLAQWLCAARTRLSASLGAPVQDVLFSNLACHETFARFAADIILRHREMFELHGQALRSWRAEHGAHTPPVPDLRQRDDATEVPLWIYRPGGPREPLFAAAASGAVQLAGVGAVVGRVPLDPDAAVGALLDLVSRGFLVAPRALTLTMFVRSFVADLFVHGLGGALYDAIGDDLARRWFGWVPPAFLLATATVHLDLPVRATSAADVARARWTRHHAWHNPARYRPSSAEASDPAVPGLLVQQERLLHEIAAAPRFSQERAGRFRQLHDVRAKLRTQFQPVLDRLDTDVHNRAFESDQNRLARNREYFFALAPREKLLALVEQARAYAAATRAAKTARAEGMCLR